MGLCYLTLDHGPPSQKSVTDAQERCSEKMKGEIYRTRVGDSCGENEARGLVTP